MKRFMFLAALCVLPLCARAQEVKTERLDSVIVSASRAGKNTPVTYENVGKDALQRSNPMSSLPMSLQLLPSVVSYNEGGTGLGNSAMTIRGSKGSQINVTLNGVTLNDAESQEVFWVNIPSVASMLSSVQVQRGLGTSASGAGAFGASINMNTAFVTPDPWADMSFSKGSYNTAITTVAASTGRTASGFYASGAYSYNTTDGYIRNAFVRSSSAFAVVGWLGGRNSLRLTYLMGDQRSGITWDGIDLAQYAIDRTYNGAGEYYDELGNVYYYPNQTDNYTQHHLQLNFTHAFSDALAWATTLNYTRGDGYDEYYKCNKKLKNYGFAESAAYPAKSDLTYRKVMDNDLYVLNSDLRYRSARLDVTGGVSVSLYHGRHWGEVQWVKVFAGLGGAKPEFSSVDKSQPMPDWYRYAGWKQDYSAFARAEYKAAPWLTAYVDLQYRAVRYRLSGTDDDWLSYGALPQDRLNFNRFWGFFNPRAGFTASWGRHKCFVSAAIGHREPGRSDIKENIKGSGLEIRPERMLDLEAGYQFTADRLLLSANLYAMEYADMLLETGRLSDSGYAIKENVPRAWRRGVELAAAWEALPWLRLDGNATLSMNQIADYTSYVAWDDGSGLTNPVHYGRTTMLMSPSAIAMGQVTLMPWKGGSVSWNGKFVGKQYLDNSMREDLVVPAYFVAGLNVSQDFRLPLGKLGVSLHVNNLFNHLYYAAGWRWEAYDPTTDTVYYGMGVYPQAPINLMLKMRYYF